MILFTDALQRFDILFLAAPKLEAGMYDARTTTYEVLNIDYEWLLYSSVGDM